MSGNLDESPAKIIRKMLIDLDVVGLESADHDWPCYYNYLPNSPTNAISIYDPEGRTSGRSFQR